MVARGEIFGRDGDNMAGSDEPGAAGRRLKVLTFNTWLGGASVEDGFSKIAKHIKRIDPDIVGLQVSGPLYSFLNRMGCLTAEKLRKSSTPNGCPTWQRLSVHPGRRWHTALTTLTPVYSRSIR